MRDFYDSKLHDKLSNTLLTIALFMMASLYLFPLLWLFISSLKPASELFSYPLTLLPQNPTFDNYVQAWNTIDFMRYFSNTAITTITTTLLTVLASATCGYALAKYNYKWLKIFFVCIISTTMLPTEVIMTPTFTVIRSLGLFNTLAGVILPSINTATGIFMFRQFFMTVPDDLIESARIDGANEGSIFFKIMLPIAKPIVLTLAIFSFQWRWNDFIWPLIVLNDPRNFTIQVALRRLVGAETINWTILLAASIISIIPLFIVFFVLQRYIMDSGATSGIKG